MYFVELLGYRSGSTMCGRMMSLWQITWKLEGSPGKRLLVSFCMHDFLFSCGDICGYHVLGHQTS